MSDATPVGELYVLRLLQSSSCYRGDVCATAPCACAQSLLDEIGKPLRAEIERLKAGIEEYACTGTDHPCGCHTLLTADKARIERLKAMIQCLIDNHDHGSYESEGQAFDEARAALAGTEG